MKRVCKQCGKTFELSGSEIAFYKKKNLNLPKRCKECRQANKQNRLVPEGKEQSVREPAADFSVYRGQRDYADRSDHSGGSGSFGQSDQKGRKIGKWVYGLIVVILLLLFGLMKLWSGDASPSGGGNAGQPDAAETGNAGASDAAGTENADVSDPAGAEEPGVSAADGDGNGGLPLSGDASGVEGEPQGGTSDAEELTQGETSGTEGETQETAGADASASVADASGAIQDGTDTGAASLQSGAEAGTGQEQIQGEASAEVQYTFRNSKLLSDHYEKHGKEMGFSSPEEYQAAADAVVRNENALHKTEKEDGDDVYYLESTNEFVIVSTDGFIRTYFYPNAGIDYYNRQ